METPGTKPLTDEADNRDKAKIFMDLLQFCIYGRRGGTIFSSLCLKLIVVTMLMTLLGTVLGTRHKNEQHLKMRELKTSMLLSFCFKI